MLIATSLAFVFTAATMFTFALRTPALWAFLAVLGLNVVALALSSVNSLRQRRLTRQSHEVLVRAWRPAALPGVDLYLPTCGEPPAVLDNAYRAVAAVDWPADALTVWVLDDADRPEVAALAARHGYRYVVRPDRGHLKKAGNLNHALTLSSGEFIAILDADFAPRPDFLRHLVPYLSDPAVGIVQSPQCFDTDGTMSCIQRAGRAYRECDTWRADTLERLGKQAKPRLVVVSSLNRYTADEKLLAEGWEKTLAPLRALGVPVVYVEDTPVPGADVPACVSGSPDSPADCAFGRADALRPDPPARRIASGALPGVRSVGVNEVLCPGEGPTCPAVLDRIPLYRDDAHLTNAAAAVLTNRLERLLTEAGALPAAAPAGKAVAAAGSAGAASTVGGADGWTRLLRDDFDGPAGSPPSAANWMHDVGTCYPGCPAPQWGTGEVETMTDSTDNVRLDGKGALEIVPTRKDGAGSSGRIEIRRSDFTPPPGGALRIEASIALPDVTGAGAAGYWPAFWTLEAPLRDGYTGWPGVGELDVMESVNGRDTVFGSMHCGVPDGGPCPEPVGLTSGPQPCPDYRTAFHPYAVEVDLTPGAEEVRRYLEGRVHRRVTADRMDSATWKRAVHHGLFLILNVAVGGKLPQADGADVGPKTQPGQPMRVDHVTVSARERRG